MSNRVSEILSWYASENPGVQNNLYRLLNHGRLAGTGKMAILPVDQGFEHGPTDFDPNPDCYDPHYHFQLAIDSGLNAYAAPLGFLESGISKYVGQIPTILKLNSHDVLHNETDPMGGQTATIKDALRLGCIGIGYTIYYGTKDRRFQYEQVREIIAEAKDAGLFSIIWAYPRGGDLSKEGETALDVISYSTHISCQLGAHIVKAKFPSAHIEKDVAKKSYEQFNIPRTAQIDRVKQVVRSAFNGRRLVIFSGGPIEPNESALLDTFQAICDGGGAGSIIGRNVFQRERKEAMAVLDKIVNIYKG